MTKKSVSFRPQFDVEELNEIVEPGQKSKFYNYAILKEIDYRKSNSSHKYHELQRETRDKEKQLQLTIKELTETKELIEEYEKRVKRLERKRKKQQKELDKMTLQLKKLKTTTKQVKRGKKETQKLIEQNRDIIEQYSKELVTQGFNPNFEEWIPKFMTDNFKTMEEYKPVKETFGTFENFINTYFYNYLEEEVLNNKHYMFTHINKGDNASREDFVSDEEKEEIKQILEDKSLLL